MSNDLMKMSGGVPMSAEDLKAGLQTASQSIQGGDGGILLLRLLKSGIYVYGPENLEIEAGSQWAVNPYSISHGWVCWGDSELLDERMVPFNQAPPARSELPDLGYEWSQQVSMGMQCLNGEDEGVLVLYKGSSKGLRNAIKQLIAALVTQLGKDSVNFVPVLELNVDSYTHPKWGETFVPDPVVVDWMPMDGETETAAPEEGDAVAEDGEGVPAGDDETATIDHDTGEVLDEKPARTRRGAAKPKPSPEKPARRRRGAAAKEAPAAADEAAPARRRRRRG